MKTTRQSCSGWDQIGDDDELYIQSDDHPLPSARTLLPIHQLHSYDRQHQPQPRKRRRISDSSRPVIPRNNLHLTSNSHHYPSSSRENDIRSVEPPRGRTARQSGPAKSRKYDPQGCANCRTHQSTTWWRKNRLVSNLNGVESWEEEKLCNTCSIHWNKNGFHRNVRYKSKKQPESLIDPCLRGLPRPYPQLPRSHLRASSPSRSSTAGPSSPSLSLSNLPPAPPHYPPRRNARSLSILTRAAEGEAHKVQRSVTRKTGEHAGTSVSKHHRAPQDAQPSTFPIFPPLFETSPTPKLSETKSNRNSHADLAGFVMTKETQEIINTLLIQPPPPPDPTTSTTTHEDLFSEFINEDPPDQSGQALDFSQFSEAVGVIPPPLSDHFSHTLGSNLSPPRTPPSRQRVPTKNHKNPRDPSKSGSSPLGSPSFDQFLSPSFLDGSPNSLLRKLPPAQSETPPKSINPIIERGVGAELLGSNQFQNCDKIFLSSPASHQHSDLLAPPSPTYGEPSKRTKGISKWRDSEHIIPTLSSSNLQTTPSSATSAKSSIFPGAVTWSNPKPGDHHSPAKFLSPNADDNQIVSKSPTHAGSDISLSSKLKLTPNLFGSTAFVTNPAPFNTPPPREPASVNRSQLVAHMRPNGTHEHTIKRVASRPTQPRGRTIWSKRPGSSSSALPSEDTGISLDGPERPRTRHYLSPSSSLHSETRSDIRYYTEGSTIIAPELQQTGLSSSMKHTFRSRSLMDKQLSSERMEMDRSSPPVLPPPSDCSEGIASHSPGLFSDEDEDSADEIEEIKSNQNGPGPVPTRTLDPRFGSALRKVRTSGLDIAGTRNVDKGLVLSVEQEQGRRDQRGSALKDITHASLNEPVGPAHPLPERSTQVTQKRPIDLDRLSPEMMTLFREAIRIGWTPHDFAQAIENAVGARDRQAESGSRTDREARGT